MRVEKIALGSATQLNAGKTYQKKQPVLKFKANHVEAGKVVKSGGIKAFTDIIEKIKENVAKLNEAVKRRREIVDKYRELVVKANEL